MIGEPGGSFVRVMAGRIIYRVAINALDEQWRWVCSGCGRRFYNAFKTPLAVEVRLHHCPSGELATRWLIAGRRRYRSK